MEKLFPNKTKVNTFPSLLNVEFEQKIAFSGVLNLHFYLYLSGIFSMNVDRPDCYK